MTSTDPALLPATELVRRYRRGSLSPVAVVEACLERVARWNGAVGAFTHVDAAGARAAAAASEARWRRQEPCGPLDGVPATVKDLLLVRGWTLRRGSRSTAGAAPATEDSPAAARLREAGAVLLGSTTTPEFGWKAVTDNPLGEVARNPWHQGLTPGGSSGGAAVAAALGMGALHVGTDGGGSIRIPASFTGIVGLKPTFGRVPAWPLSPFGTVAHVGPMARTVTDAALMLSVLSGPDRRDWHALPPDPRDHRVGLADGVEGLRVAASATLGGGSRGGGIEADPEVLGVFEAALAVLADLGARVQRVDPPVGDGVRELFARTWFPGATRLVERLPEAARAGLDKGLLAVAEAGGAYTRAELQDAQLERGELGVRLQAFLGQHDLLATPATARPAFALGRDHPAADGERPWIDWAGFSYPFNLTQQPAVSVPAGFTAAGLPVGLQLVGAKYADDLVLRAARAFEAACPQPMAAEPRGA
jgi:aspartyl-tRNA(Asn)/glutamyl-tRNA(Gln) amidotransferase subunit A